MFGTMDDDVLATFDPTFCRQTSSISSCPSTYRVRPSGSWSAWQRD